MSRKPMFSATAAVCAVVTALALPAAALAGKHDGGHNGGKPYRLTLLHANDGES